MAHLTYFDTIEEYNAYINSEDYVSPNISYCADADAVFMKENFVPSMSAVFNITSTGTTQIANTTDGIKAIRVDGQLMGELSNLYKFESTGNHTVEYQFRKQNTIPKKIFYNYTAITSVDLSNISYIGDDNFYGCINTQFGNLVFNGNIGNNCFQGVYGLTSIVVNGSIGNSNLSGNINLTSARINGNIGNSNIMGVTSLTDVYIDGNIGDGNFGGVNTMTAATVNGSIGSGNFGGCSNIKTLKIGGTVRGGGNFDSMGSKYDTVEIGGDIEGGNNLYCNNSLTTNITVSGSANGGGTYFTSGDTLVISGNCGNPTIRYWKDVIIGRSITGSGLYFTGAQNVVVSGDVAGNEINWYQDSSMPCQSFTINGSITANSNFTNMTSPIMVDVGGSIANGCFNGINITDRTTYTVHGNLGSDSFCNVTGLTDVTVEGNVGPNCFGGSNSITSLTLTQACESYGGFVATAGTWLTKLTINNTTPPALSNTIPSRITVYVPASAVDTYKAASGWSTYASQIQAIPNE